jgi:lysozyme
LHFLWREFKWEEVVLIVQWRKSKGGLIAPTVTGGTKTVEDLKDQLIRHEALRLKMYKDSLGILTIGVGHNLQDKPISKAAAMQILEDDINDAKVDLAKAYPWVVKLSLNRQNVLINMCFNMGIERLSTFKNTLRMVESGDYAGAATNMLQSKWATQVGDRAKELAEIMKTGGSN